MDIENRLFVVGCARSGTTLVQAMLASHSKLYGFPETFYFLDSMANANGKATLVARFRKHRMAHYAYENAMRRLGIERAGPALFLSENHLSKKFLRQLDAIATENGKSVWSEKTPGHINCINRVQGYLPDAKFVHVLRDGRDVVASLEHLYRQKVLDPDDHTSAWPLQQSIQHWNRAIAISRSCFRRHNHFFLDYEELLASPAASLSDLCDFIGIGFEPEMIEYYKHAKGVLGSDIVNSWRTGVLQPLQSTHLKKYNDVFSEEDRLKLEVLLFNNGRIELPD